MTQTRLLRSFFLGAWPWSYLLLGLPVMQLEAVDALRVEPSVSTVRAGRAFPLTVSAWTNGVLDKSATDSVALEGVTPRAEPQLLISRIEIPRSQTERRIELVNVSSNPVEFRGEVQVWVEAFPGVLKYRPESFAGVGQSGPIRLMPGERFLLTGDVPSGYQGQFRHSGAAGQLSLMGAVFVVQDGVAWDAWVGTNYLALRGTIPSASDGLPVWNGAGLAGDSRGQYFYRAGRLRRAAATDWMGVTTRPTVTPLLELPLASVPRFSPVIPSRVQLTAGRWEGWVTLVDPSSNVVLHADNRRGATGESSPIVVLEGAPLRLESTPGSRLKEGGDPVTVRVGVDEALDQDLVVELQSSNPEELEVPPTVTLPAGTLFAAFPATSVDDGLVDGGQRVELSASAPGFVTPPALVLTNLDSSENAMSLIMPEQLQPASLDSFRLPVEIHLDRPFDRTVNVQFRAVCQSHPAVDDVAAWMKLPSVLLPPGTRHHVVSSAFSGYPLGFPAKFRITASVPGSPEAEAEFWINPQAFRLSLKWIQDIPLSALEQAKLTWISSEQAWVSNALRLEIPLRLESDRPLRLESSRPDVLELPKLVIVPAYSKSVPVPFKLHFREKAAASRLVTLVATAFDGSRATVSEFISGDGITGIEVLPSGQSGASFVSGMATQVTLRLLNDLRTVDPPRSSSLYSGTLPLSFDFRGQPVLFEGPSNVVFTSGVARLPMRFTGPTRGFELILQDPEGALVRSEDLEVTAATPALLPETDLAILSAGPTEYGIDGHRTIPLLVTNLGPAVARRVGIAFGAFSRLLRSQGKAQVTLPIGDLNPGESAEVRMPIEFLGETGDSALAGFTSKADNPDSNRSNDQLYLPITALPVPVAGAKEISLPQSDLAYSAETGRFYGSRATPSPTIVELDPYTAQVVREFQVPGLPRLMQASTVGRQLYVLLDTGASLLRIDLATGRTNLWFTLPTHAQDLAVIPGSSNQVVVTGVDSRARLFTDAALAATSAQKVDWVEPDADGKGVVALGERVWVSETGSSWLGTMTEASAADVAAIPRGADGGWRAWQGRPLAVSMGGSIRFPGYPLAYSPAGVAKDVVVDPTTGMLYYAAIASSRLTLIGFDPLTPASKRIHPLSEIQGVSRLTRFGARGLAFRALPDRMVFLESSIVAGGEASDVAVTLEVEPSPLPRGRYRVRVGITNSGPSLASNAVVVLRLPSGDRLSGEEGGSLVTQEGSYLRSLGDLPVGQALTLRFEASIAEDQNIAGVIRAEVFGNWLESNSSNNLALMPRMPEVSSAAPFRLTGPPAFSLTRGEIVLPVKLPPGGFLDDPYALVVLNASNYVTVRVFSMAEEVAGVVLSADESVLHVVSGGSRSLRQVDPWTGATRAWAFAQGSGFISSVVSPVGYPDVAVALEQESLGGGKYTPPQLVTYQSGRAIATRLVGSGGLARGAGQGEVLSGFSGSVGPMQVLRFTGQGMELLSSPAALSSVGTSFALPAGWVVTDSGEIYAASDRSYAGKLWDDTIPWRASAHPALPLLLTARADFSNDPQTHLALWDVASQRVISERHLPVALGSIVRLELLEHATFLHQGFEGGFQLEACPAANLPEVEVRCTAAADRVAVGDLITLEVRVANRGSSPLTECSLAFNLTPLILEGIDGPEPVHWVKDANRVTFLEVGTVQPGKDVRYHLRLRSVETALVALAASFRTTTFHRRIDTSPPAFVLIGTNGSRDLVSSLAFGFQNRVSGLVGRSDRDEFWFAHHGLLNHLIKLDFDGVDPQVSAVIPLPFFPETLALNSDGTSLYAAPTFGSIHRFDLRPGASSASVRLLGSRGEGYGVTALATAPGSPGRLAASERNTADSRLLLFEDGLLQAQQHSLGTAQASQLTFASDAQLLAALPRTNAVSVISLSATENGLASARTVNPSLPAVPFIHSGGVLYFQEGTTVDLATGGIKSSFPSSATVIPDVQRDLIYTSAAFSPVLPSAPRLLSAQRLGKAEVFWAVRSPFLTGGSDPQSWVGAHSLAIRSRVAGSYGLDLVALESLAVPQSTLDLKAEWNPPWIPAGVGSTLVLSVSNTGPWVCSNVVLQLPAEYDSQFTNWIVEGLIKPVLRKGSELLITNLAPRASVTMDFFYRGSPVPLDWSPRFELTSASPSLVGAPIPVEPMLHVTDAVSLRVLPLTVRETEDLSVARIVVRLSRPSTKEVVCLLETVSGEATSPADFIPLSQRLRWPPGTMEAVAEVIVKGDRIEEPVERFWVRLVELIGAVAVEAEAPITILDNDGPGLQMTPVEQSEGDQGTTNARAVVRLATPGLAPVRYYYQLIPETATAGLDYLPKYGVLEFASGDLEQSIGLGIVGDIIPEREERFSVVLQPLDDRSNAGGSASILIRDDDPVPLFRLSVEVATGAIRIEFQSVAGMSYQLERTQVIGGEWQTVGESLVGNGGRVHFSEPWRPEQQTILYRVVRDP